MKILKIILSLFVVTLTGCAGMNNDFDCSKVGGQGVGCVSMGHVNSMADHGAFTFNDKPQASTVSTTIQVSSNEVMNKSLGFKRVTPTAGKPTRTVDEVDRIWIAPWKDKGDNYHDSNFIYTVITYSHWNDYPVAAIKGEDTL